MASTDLPTLLQHSEKEAQLDSNHPDLKLVKDSTSAVDTASDVVKGHSGPSRDASPASQSSASGLSSAKGGTQSPGPPGTTAPPLSMPHPKKFSHVNISKKFLEKSTSACPPSHTLSSSPVPKPMNSSQKSLSLTTTPHPRLVTAKLTATPQPSGAGWSRPSSTVSSSTSSPMPVPMLKSATAPASSSSTAPLPPAAGKIIQPQPRPQDSTAIRKDAAGRPVWGNSKGAAAIDFDKVQADFPTAAEVAQARILKAHEKNLAPDAVAAHKEAVMAELIAEEDTFRGVHLDPKAHHWDEMEEDDDNFLGEVIEFEDGRQYNVESNEAPRQSPPRDGLKSLPDSLVTNGLTDQPVSKEERFQDDFDRSWPRSRPISHQPSRHVREPHSAGAVTSPSTASVHSPQESSRVLFNERSNRLEPYSHQRHGGQGAPPFPNRRNSRSDYSISPTESRRDPPPHTHSQGVQLLQKGPSGGAPNGDSPTFSRAPGDRSPSFPSDGSRFRDRPPARRDHPAWQTNGAPSSEHGRPGNFGMSHPPGRPRDGPYEERGRRSAFDAPPSPAGDHQRQLPPHLLAPGVRNVPPIRTELDVPPRSPVPSQSALTPSEPPAPSASSQATESPSVTSAALPTGDWEEVRKAAMHSAAERARLRRQQEEEEREKEKERARRKAAEIEERMKSAAEAKARERDAEKQQTETQVLGIIQEAVSTVLSPEKTNVTDSLPDDASMRTASGRPHLGRPTSTRGAPRPFPARRTSLSTPTSATSGVSEPDTWRRRNQPPSPDVVRHDIPPAAPALPPPVLSHAHLEVKEGEDVDVVDFADMGKLVGSDSSTQVAGGARPPRAVAADFFPEEPTVPQRPPPPPSKADEGPWRRRSSFAQSSALPDKPAITAVPALQDSSNAASEAAQPNGSVHGGQPHTQAAPHEEHHRRLSGQYQNGIHKLPPGPYYREAPMSTLNDVMARIKGAIDGMHHEVDVLVPKEEPKEEPKEAPKPQKWLPPALRPKSAHPEFAHPTEVFDVTACEPPKSPKRAWNIITVKVAHDSRPLNPPPRSELVWPRGLRHLRLEIYSLNPTADIRRDSSFTDHLYGRPRYIKGQPKYFVSVPRKRLERKPRVETTPVSPVVHLPNTPPRLRATDQKDAGLSWRKPPPSPSGSRRPQLNDAQEVGLNTVSRSPPPEAPSTKVVAASPAVRTAESSSGMTSALEKSRLPAQSDVTLYRTGHAQNPATQAAVHFATLSEPDSSSKLGLVTADLKPLVGIAAMTSVISSPAKVAPPELKPDLVDRGLVNGTATPPSQSQPTVSPWAKSPKAFTVKDSPARAPDPEHLKAVWSQTPEKAQIQPVNSLKGIADDLTGVPFSLQDVKSEDGETPPPSGLGPWAKMSASEVTRAFQQVPSSSSSSSQRPAPIAPTASNPAPVAHGPVPRNPTFTFSPPPMGPPSLRPHYSAYSPMPMSSPSPTVMYSQPSPVPRPMIVNGGTPAYGQPMWMPAMPGPPQSANMMRSPYPAQLVPYPSPGGTMHMYPPPPMPGMQNSAPQSGVQGRPPGMPMVSPVMQPALPHMYAGSPVLVPAPPVMSPGQGYPIPVPGQPNRAPMRPYEPNPGTPHMPPMRQPAPNGYNPVMSNYARPPW